MNFDSNEGFHAVLCSLVGTITKQTLKKLYVKHSKCGRHVVHLEIYRQEKQRKVKKGKKVTDELMRKKLKHF